MYSQLLLSRQDQPTFYSMEGTSRDYSKAPIRLLPTTPGPKPVSQVHRRRPQPPACRDSSSFSWSTDDEDCSPPKPRSALAPTPPVCGSPASKTPAGSLAVPVEKGPFTLPEFVSKFGRSLPLCVSVEKGHHSDDERESIGTGETYILHLVKHTKVVELRSPDGTTYNFPLSSSVQFAPIFRDADEKESDSEQTFERVADVVGQKPLPRLLRATKTFTRDNKTLVEKNEVLYVQKVASGSSIGATLKRRRSLRVYSFLHNREKLLPSECEGGFTADPYATRLYLSDIVSFFMEEFPLRVRVHLTDVELEEGSEFPFHLSSEVSDLTEINTETSLVASTYRENSQTSASGRGGEGEEEEKRFIDIPISLEIEVSIFQPEQDDKDSELFQRTKSLLQDFSAAKIRSINRSSADLAGTTRKGYEREGVEFEESDRVYEVIGQHSRSLLSPRVKENSQDSTYAEIEDVLTYQKPPSPRQALNKKDQAAPPPVSPKPPPRKPPVRCNTIGGPSDQKRECSPLAKPPAEVGRGLKMEVGRKLSVDSAVNSGENPYQALLNTRSVSESESSSAYVTLGQRPTARNSVITGTKSQQVMMNSLTATAAVSPARDGTVEDNGTLIRDLIGRIESLEQQVEVLTEKVEQLSR